MKTGGRSWDAGSNLQKILDTTESHSKSQNNQEWMKQVTSGEYMKYYERMYSRR